jgi:hypothetical protein
MRRTLAVPVLLAFGLLGTGCAGEDPPAQTQAPVEAETSGSSSSSTDIAASCVEVYSPETLANRAFALDGTVASIETRADPKLPAGERETPWVTFDVNRWFLGGSGETVGIWMDGVNIETSAGTVNAEPGMRLLVAGEPRWGGDPLDDPLAWTCGFTQDWTEQAAAEWKAATA